MYMTTNSAETRTSLPTGDSQKDSPLSSTSAAGLLCWWPLTLLPDVPDIPIHPLLQAHTPSPTSA